MFYRPYGRNGTQGGIAAGVIVSLALLVACTETGKEPAEGKDEQPATTAAGELAEGEEEGKPVTTSTPAAGIEQGQSTDISASTVRPANPGVSDESVLVGMSAVFSGPSTGLGVEMWRGVQAAFQEVNEKGGVHGRKLELRLADDQYEADQAASAIVKLVEEDNVFNTGWSVGTPTIVKALPVILSYYNSEDLFHFGNFTGAQPQRTFPYNEAVFNIRASYRQETAAMVDQFVALGKKKIGVYAQADAYGSDGREGVKLALAKHNLELNSDTSYPRGQSYDVSAAEQVKDLRSNGTDAVIMIGSYQACAAFIRDARLSGWDVPVHNVSFVGPEQLLGFLREEEKKTGKRIVYNIVNTLVVPHYEDTSLAMVREYSAAMDKYLPDLPSLARESGYQVDQNYTFGSLEAYITGRIYVQILEKAGKDLTRRKFIEAAESMKEFDVGLDSPAEFRPDRHQAFDNVWFTYATSEGWKPIQPPLGRIFN